MKLVVNGIDVEVDDRHAKTPLLWVLRDVVGLHGTKFGCGAGFCAACTVLIDGRNTKSCQTATERAVGKTVTTVEGASGRVVNAVRDGWHHTTDGHMIEHPDPVALCRCGGSSTKPFCKGAHATIDFDRTPAN